MKVIVISKTRMHNSMCVGAIQFDGTGIRLLDQNGFNQPFNTPLQIGQIWEVTFSERIGKIAPHNEDVLVTASSFTNQRIDNLSRYLIHVLKVTVWRDTPNNLFGGLIRWTGKGGGYISERTGIPTVSVGFFMFNQDIRYENKHYIFPTEQGATGPNKQLAYVGNEEPIPIIPAGTLIRVSLARWWKPEDVDIEKRCYVQLSGWYIDHNKGKNILQSKWEKSILIEKDYVVALYFFKSIDEIVEIKVGDEVPWLKITARTAIKKDTGEEAKLKDGRTIYIAEKIYQI